MCYIKKIMKCILSFVCDMKCAMYIVYTRSFELLVGLQS